MDDSFGQPKSVIFISLQSNTANSDPFVMMRLSDLSEYILEDLNYRAVLGLYLSIFKAQMDSFFQELNRAKITVSINVKAHNGLEISIAGFSDKLPKVLETIIKGLTGPLDQKYFEIGKTQAIWEIRNSMLETPANQAVLYLKEMNADSYFSAEELTEATNRLEWKDMKADLLTGMKPKMLVVGNTLRETAVQLFDQLKMVFRGKEEHKISVFDWKSKGKIYERGPIEHLDNAIAIYYPITNQSIYYMCSAVHVFSRILSEAFFNALRTREQLGYTVEMSTYSLHDSFGIMFKVHSKVDPTKLHERVHKFIAQEVPAVISKITERELIAVKDSLIATCFSWPGSLFDEAKAYWAVITNSADLSFDRNAFLRLYLKSDSANSLKMELILIFVIMSNPANSIAVHVRGKGSEPVKG